MKDSSEYAARLKRLCNRLQRSGGKTIDSEPADVTTELLLACLSEHMTESKTRSAFNKLRSNFVDYNELRVMRPAEVVEILGKGFAQYRPAFGQMVRVLRALFDEQDHLDLEHLKSVGKREARGFLEGLEGTSGYVVSRVMLRALGGHAFPIHKPMLQMLQAEEVVDTAADIATVQGFLERQITSKRIHKVYALLRRYTDVARSPRPSKKTTKKATSSTKKKTKTTQKKSRKSPGRKKK